jgi:DNA (cytosine-5)-methyltransferase 1
MGSRRKMNGAIPERTHRAKGEILEFPDLPVHRGVGEFLRPYSSKKFFEQHEVATEGTFYPDLVRVPPGKNYMALKKDDGSGQPKYRPGGRFWNFLLKLHPDEPSWTIPANPGPWVGPFHWSDRRLRVPEVAAIQTFPDGYVFKGNRRSVQKQLGNAVPPLLGQHMISFLKGQL